MFVNCDFALCNSQLLSVDIFTVTFITTKHASKAQDIRNECDKLKGCETHFETVV